MKINLKAFALSNVYPGFLIHYLQPRFCRLLNQLLSTGRTKRTVISWRKFAARPLRHEKTTTKIMKHLVAINY